MTMNFKKLAIGLFAAFGIVTAAYAAQILSGPTSVDGSFTVNAPNATSLGGTLAVTGAATLNGAISTPAHINTGATPPVLTACGTTPSITGSDTAGIVTMGTSATGCVITFATPYTGTPYCVVSWIATPLASQSYVTSNVAITTTQTSTSNNKLQYVCIGPNGG
jgi:hypothetical protein